MPVVRRLFCLCLLAALLLLTARARAQDWDRSKTRADLAAGKPLVVHVRVALCSNDQIDCGSKIAGRPGNLSHNVYWGAVFGARRFLEMKSSGWERLSLGKLDDVVLERAVYRRSIPGKRWGLSRKLEQIVVLDAVHGDRIDQAVSGFWASATGGEKLVIDDGAQKREVAVHVTGYVGHNRLMDGLELPERAESPAAIPSFVLACYSENYFGKKLRRAGSEPLVMTKQLMAPEGYVLQAVLTGIGDNKDQKQIRLGAVLAYAKWQKLSHGSASWIFAGK
ncbi:MAG: hypothetical protein HS104_06995 [Polyangiaceae bacterium]|nr:hypothetical protein [Polyangiaceae bacterium]